MLVNCLYVYYCSTYSGPEAGWRSSVLPGFSGAVPHYLAVDGTANAVVQLHIQLR